MARERKLDRRGEDPQPRPGEILDEDRLGVPEVRGDRLEVRLVEGRDVEEHPEGIPAHARGGDEHADDVEDGG